MTTWPVDPAFGVPQPANGAAPDSSIAPHVTHWSGVAGTSGAPTAIPPAETAGAAGAEPAGGGDVEWASSELSTIASTIAELQSRLEQTNAQLATATKVGTDEAEIGRLFVEAQQFSDASLARLEQQVNDIICEAEAKAHQILTEATAEAHEIRRQAQEAAFASTVTARELQTAIAGFTMVNSELLKELADLHSMLTPAAQRPTAPVDPSHPFGLPEMG